MCASRKYICRNILSVPRKSSIEVCVDQLVSPETSQQASNMMSSRMNRREHRLMEQVVEVGKDWSEKPAKRLVSRHDITSPWIRVLVGKERLVSGKRK